MVSGMERAGKVTNSKSWLVVPAKLVILSARILYLGICSSISEKISTSSTSKLLHRSAEAKRSGWGWLSKFQLRQESSGCYLSCTRHRSSVWLAGVLTASSMGNAYQVLIAPSEKTSILIDSADESEKREIFSLINLQPWHRLSHYTGGWFAHFEPFINIFASNHMNQFFMTAVAQLRLFEKTFLCLNGQMCNLSRKLSPHTIESRATS